jgi:nucleotide-binding universal stress UspA family protein
MTHSSAKAQNESNPRTGQYRVVAASDFTELGDRAVLEGLRLCAAHPGAALHVLTVGIDSILGVRLPGAEPRILPTEEAQEAARARVAAIVDAYVAGGERVIDMENIAVYVTLGWPAERIVALATSVDADMIVLGTHGRRGLERFMDGSVAEAVVRRAPCGVLVIRPRDFLGGEKVPDVQPPLKPGEHPLLPFRESATYHYVDRMTQGTSRIMP